MYFIGIDVAAARPSDIVVVDESLRQADLIRSADPTATAPEIAARYRDAVIAVDASRCLSQGLMADPTFRANLDSPPADGRCRNCRHAEYELMRRNISVYQTPQEMPDWLRGWLTEGFGWYEALIEAGYADHSLDPAAEPPCVIESYPYANFVALLGGLPPGKSTRDGRVARVMALRQAGVEADFAVMDADQLDATVCAVAAARFARGAACDYGDPREGALTVAANLPDRARPIDMTQMKAQEGTQMAEDCLFCKIAAGEIDSEIVHEDDRCVAFRDINPQAPTHILVIPRQHIPGLDTTDQSDQGLLGHLLLTAAQVAREEDIADDGYRTVINWGRDGGMEVEHLHVHLLGGRAMSWPPG